MNLSQKFQTADGQLFDTKAEATDHLRRPLITAALNKLDGNNSELTNWLIDNQNDIEAGFEATSVQRVTKSEKKQLEKALDAIKASNDRAFSFVATNAASVLESFRWPSVKRGTKEEQAKTIHDGFMKITGDNKDLSDWIIANEVALLEAFRAGIVKREVNPKAADALAAYRAKRAEQKAELEAAAAKDAELGEGVTKNQDQVKAAHKAEAEAAELAKSNV